VKKRNNKVRARDYKPMGRKGKKTGPRTKKGFFQIKRDKGRPRVFSTNKEHFRWHGEGAGEGVLRSKKGWGMKCICAGGEQPQGVSA